MSSTMICNKISCTSGASDTTRVFLKSQSPFVRSMRSTASSPRKTLCRSYFHSENGIPPALREDWREFRAKLVKKDYAVNQQRSSRSNSRGLGLKSIYWSHPTQILEKGCVLLSNSKTSFEEPSCNEMFYKSVVILVDYTPGGTAMGLLINRPTPALVGRRHGDAPAAISSLSPDMRTIFRDNRLFRGGPTEPQLLTVLHGRDDVWGSTEIIPGVRIGGIEAAADLVRSGEASTEEFRFFEGAVFWAPGELDEQVARGIWNLSACSRHLILRDALDLRAPLWIEIQERMNACARKDSDNGTGCPGAESTGSLSGSGTGLGRDGHGGDSLDAVFHYDI